VEKTLVDEVLAVAYQQLAADAAATAWASRAAMTLDAVVSYALAESVESSS
jgi:hypothetical protein